MSKNWSQILPDILNAWPRSKGNVKAYALKRGMKPKSVSAEALFLELEPNVGIMIDLARNDAKEHFVRMTSWPSLLPDSEKSTRFVARACCANVTELGLEVETRNVSKERKPTSSGRRRPKGRA